MKRTKCIVQYNMERTKCNMRRHLLERQGLMADVPTDSRRAARTVSPRSIACGFGSSKLAPSAIGFGSTNFERPPSAAIDMGFGYSFCARCACACAEPQDCTAIVCA